MSNDNIKVLNKITKKLIDTQYGYSKGAEIIEDDHALKTELSRRANARSNFVSDFQSTVRMMGQEPETDGTMTGRIHEGFTKFSALFRDDKKAALSAIDDAEEMLADEVKDAMDDKDITPQVRQKLMQVYTAAKEGERFADRLEDAA
ncbi:PA2169 family four-helix-bundle protein [Fretibacter rubidus]|uniref:PA2169 family four-helix-bundle protein n=1 Tax=Fretibacter rubidus TaxID=570162 RepID=UPI00352B92D8